MDAHVHLSCVWRVHGMHTQVHEHLRSKLCELYESDCIFDKFECSWGHDDRHVCSGTYDNKLQLWDTFGSDQQCTTLESVSCASPARRSSTLKGKLGLTRKDSVRRPRLAIHGPPLGHAVPLPRRPSLPCLLTRKVCKPSWTDARLRR